MPKLIKDETTEIIKSALARNGHTSKEIAQRSGLKEATLNYHIRNPEMLRLDEIRTLIRYGKFSEDDKRYLLEGRKL